MQFENINNCPEHQNSLIEIVCEDCKALFCNSCGKAHSSHNKFLLPTVLFQDYHFVEYLGKGTFGKVFSVININDRSRHAMKLIENVGKQDSAIASKELQIHKGLHHPNIIELCHSEYIEENDQEIMALFLELADTNFEEIVQSITQDEAFKLFLDICHGMKFLHDRDIIHRDIKLGNVLIKNKKAKLCDFGQSTIQSNSVKSFSCHGTKVYWPPEIFKGKKYERKGDIWALGILFHKILTKNKHPFNNDLNRIKDGKIEIDESIKEPLYLKILEGIIFIFSKILI